MKFIPALILFFTSTIFAAAATDTRYSVGGIPNVLIDGVACPEAIAWWGGDPSGSAIVETATGPDGSFKKHLGPVSWDPITIETALPLSPSLLSCVADLCANRSNPKPLLLTNYTVNGQPISPALQANGLLTEIQFPELDASFGKNLRVKFIFRVENVQPVAAANRTTTPARATTGSSSNFKVIINGLPTNRISRVGSFTIKRAGSNAAQGLALTDTAQTSGTVIPNLVVELIQADAPSWLAWRDSFIVQGQNSDTAEKDGTLEILAPNMTTSLFTLQLSHLGLMRAAMHSENEQITRLRAELYCESMSVATTPSTSPASTSSSTTPAPASGNSSTPPATTPDSSTPPQTTPTTPKEKTPTAVVKDRTLIPIKELPSPNVPIASREAATNPNDKGGRDPSDFPRVANTVRTGFSAVREPKYLREDATYEAKGSALEISALYEKALSAAGWKDTAHYENDNGTNRAHQILSTWTKEKRTASLTFVDVAPGSVGIQVIVQLRE